MRVDKFLKVSRIIKRRSIANQACSAGAVRINGKNAKPGSQIKPNDILEIELGTRLKKYEILEIADTVAKDQAASLYKEI